jgi:hypothetical protein
MIFTLVELGPLQKWVAKPIGNTSDNTLKNVSDNTLKNVSTTSQKGVEHNSSRRCFQEDHEGSS